FTLILITVALVYSYYRCIAHVWDWIEIEGFQGIYYADVFYLILCGQILLFINAVVRSEKFGVVWNRLLVGVKLRKAVVAASDGYDGFFCDESIGAKGKDELGYKSYADRLAKKIMATQSENSFAIGLNGNWGSGKTSFMDLLKRSLPKNGIL